MNSLFLVAVIFFVSAVAAVDVNSNDISRWKAALTEAVNGDIASAYWGALGLSSLSETVPSSICKVAEGADASDIASLFRAVTIANAAKCKLNMNAGAAIDDALASGEASKIHYAVEVASFFKHKVDSQKVLSSLKTIIKGKYTVSAAGHVLSAAAALGLKKTELKPFHDLTEDIIHQGDMNDVSLSFDGGLLTTSVVVRGAYEIAAAYDSAPIFKKTQVEKLVNYLLGSKYASGADQIASVVASLAVFANNKFHVPVVLSGSSSPLSGSSKALTAYATNTLGRGLDVAVTAKSVVNSDRKTVLKDSALTVADKASGRYTLTDSALTRGTYTVTLSASAKDSKYMTKDEVFKTRVVVSVVVSDVEFYTAEGNVQSNKNSLKFPDTLSKVVEIDDHQKVGLKFKLKEKSSQNSVKAHQVFARLSNRANTQEVFFIAEANEEGLYSLEISLGGDTRQQLNAESGEYTLQLFVGDASFENAIDWTAAKLNVNFSGSVAAKKEPLDFFHSRPEIEHMFRQPESRPPVIISTVFTALVLAPTLLLLVLWVKLDANIRAFPYSLSAILFHVCLGLILYLFVTFWVRLNMFDTLKYLVILSIPTFIFGKATLGAVAASRLSSSNK